MVASVGIAPLMPTALATSSSSEAHSSTADLSLGSTPPLPSHLPSSPPRETSSRVLLAVSLKEYSSVPNLDEWTKWLRSEAPYDIQRINVKIEAAFSGNSTLILVSIPISIWIHLPDTSTYRFVGFIKSDNFWRQSPPMNSKKTATATSRENFTLKASTVAIPIDTPSHTLLEQEQKAMSTDETDIENAEFQDSIALFRKDFIADSHEDAPTTSADPSPVVTSKSGLEQAAHFDDDVYREARRLLEWVERNKNARREELKWFDSIKNVKREELEWLDSMDPGQPGPQNRAGGPQSGAGEL
jgi:hypothetical protein